MIPTREEFKVHESTQLLLNDIYDTLVKGVRDDRAFWAYICEPTQEKFVKQKSAAFRHALSVHEGDGHAIDKDSGKHHLANMTARAFMARLLQIELTEGRSMKRMEESIDE